MRLTVTAAVIVVTGAFRCGLTCEFLWKTHTRHQVLTVSRWVGLFRHRTNRSKLAEEVQPIDSPPAPFWTVVSTFSLAQARHPRSFALVRDGCDPVILIAKTDADYHRLDSIRFKKQDMLQ